MLSLVWFLIGVVFVGLELASPSFILIFFAAGSWVCGLILFAFDIGLSYQILIFIVVSLTLLFCLRKFFIKTFKGDAKGNNVKETLDADVLGQTVEVSKAISPMKVGEIKFRGSFWKAYSENEIKKSELAVIASIDEKDALAFQVTPYNKH